jgi:hypothetical protein
MSFVSTLKDLDKLIKLCRQRGIQSIKIDNIEMHLGDMPTTYRRQTSVNTKKSLNTQVDNFGEISDNTKIETSDELTEEQLLFYSAQGHEQVEA